MAKALVSGTHERVEQVATALREAGAEVVTVTDPARMGEAVGGLAKGSLDCYVQLPVQVEVEGESVVRRVRTFLERGLLTRFEAAATVLPVLSEQGVVVLVAGNTASEGGGIPDDAAARLALLNVLAHALRADRAPDRLRVRILDADVPADQVAGVGLGQATAPRASAGLSRSEAELSYEDWRAEIMGMATVQV